MKKIISVFCLLLCLWAAEDAKAEGEVILDLDNGRKDTVDISVPPLIEMGARYIQDVKEYHQLLDGKNIKKDISADIRSKHPDYNEDMVEKWQEYVKTGVEGYRAYEAIKKKIVSWFMNIDVPLVVADDQYEMGEDEEYIESDQPVVIHKFKKVVAYSNQKKDRLAAEEKYAKDHNMQSPSAKIALYKKALMEKDWSTVLGFNWKEWIKEIREVPEGQSDKNENAYSAILSRYNGIDGSGQIEGTVMIEPAKANFVLLSDYLEYEGLNVDFSQSENAENFDIYFTLPYVAKTKNNKSIAGYGSDFSIYFKAKAKDATKPVRLKPVVTFYVCAQDVCHKEALQPVLDLDVEEKVRETRFSTHVMMVSQSVPNMQNQKYYEFKKLVFKKGDGEASDRIELEVSADNVIKFDVFLIGEEAKYFDSPIMRLENGKAVVTFNVNDPQFSPVGKELRFWVSLNGGKQYIHTMKAEEPSAFDMEGDKVSLGILWLAFVGGMLLNLMPCVFPVLSLKLLAFTKFGGLNKENIRRNFMYNSLGILTSFAIVALGLAALKLSGQALGWGMQFQNAWFLSGMIWIVALFLMHVLGLINLRAPMFASKILDKNKNDGRLFEFLSGMFLVLLSTPCMAPYLGTAFGIAFAGSVSDILLTVFAVGLGLATPYLLFVWSPDLAFYMPKPGKWLKLINFGMVLMLVITLVWLIAVLSAYGIKAGLAFWGMNILALMLLLFVRRAVLEDLDKEEPRKTDKKNKCWIEALFAMLLAALVAYSMAKAVKRAEEYKNFAISGFSSQVLENNIKKILRSGKKVLLKIDADWCLTCHYNEAFVFNDEIMEDFFIDNNVTLIHVDWTRHNAEILDFMQKHGRRGLPFYMLFSPKFPNGIVLPEMLDANDLQTAVDL